MKHVPEKKYQVWINLIYNFTFYWKIYWKNF